MFGVWTGRKETVKDKDRPVDRKRNIKEDTEMLRLPGYLHSLQCEAGGKWDILAYIYLKIFCIFSHYKGSTSVQYFDLLIVRTKVVFLKKMLEFILANN